MQIQNIVAKKSAVTNPSRGKVVIAENLIREREMLDQDGNVINPRTKQIIKIAVNEN